MPYDVPYAAARDIVLECLADFEPEERLSVAAYAAKWRRVENVEVSPDGRWYNEKVPYTVKPSLCLDRLEHRTVAVIGPGQVAKTVIAENWWLRSVGQDPANFLWYMHSDAAVEAYVKGRIDPMIDLHENILRRRIGRMSKDDSLHFKKFETMTTEFLAFGKSTVVNKNAMRLIVDEIDNMVGVGLQGLGDVKTVLDIRRQVYGRRSKMLCMSHPDLATGLDPEREWNAGIMAIYKDSDRQYWNWPCPHCGGWSSPCPIAPRVMHLVYPTEADVPLDVVERETYLLCPCCETKIADHEREAMNVAAFRSHFGGWAGVGQEVLEDGTVRGELQQFDTAGFWIVGPMSPFVLGGIGGLAKARVKAEREAEIDGKDASLRQVMVKQWGVPYKPYAQRPSIESAALIARADDEYRRGTVPGWVRFVTVSVDCQKGYFEFLKRGWGEGKESVILDHGKMVADPATNPADWDKLRELVYDTPLPLADGSGRVMRVCAFGFDVQGEEGVTEQGYSAWLRWYRAGHARKVGNIGGREGWTILPLRGAKAIEAKTLDISYPDTGKAANKKVSQGNIPVGAFNPNRFKADLMGQLKRAEPGPTYVHLPSWLKTPGAETHPFFDQLVAERADASGRWAKIESHRRNEALDLMVMSHVMAHLWGVHKINWERPPFWARPHDVSDYVYDPVARAETPQKPLHTRLA